MSSRAFARRALVPAALASLLVGGAAASGAAPAPQAPPTTANPLEQLLRGILSPTTPPPAPAPAPPPPGPGGAPAKAPAPAPRPGPTTTVKPSPNAIPPDAQAQINAVRRSGGNSTRQLMAALRQLVEVGLSPQEAVAMGMGQFPVGGEAAFTDDWLFPRFNPSFHLHQGTDIFAARGTPVRAPSDGTVRFTEGGSAGKSAYVTAADGTYYFMCHLDSFARLPGGARVKRGDVVGTVGNTGNAQGGAYHLHFEIHPKGGGAVNPKPFLDRWLNEALATVPNILAQFQIGQPRALTSAGILRRFESSPGQGSELFLSLTGSPSGVLRLTELRAARGLGQPSQAVLEEAWKTAQETARSVLSPLTPLLLESVLVPQAS